MRRLFLAAVAAWLVACGGPPQALAGAKVIIVPPIVHKGGTGGSYFAPRPFGGFDPPPWRLVPPFYQAERPWSERAFLRNPQFQQNESFQSRLKPSATISNADHPFRQRFKGGATVRQGSIWAGRIGRGRTVEQGSIWASRVRY